MNYTCHLQTLECDGCFGNCWGKFCCFFKQKTAYEMRISDWSSDVCSSDLQRVVAAAQAAVEQRQRCLGEQHVGIVIHARLEAAQGEIGRASCRERGGQ